ncbi:serine hydrolase [Brevibacillus dissolubilis]|uniref:serine hydrolase n=1 Tax=Brevibacillus dissolubilis TaxID=1844116 RepID=UPI0011163515|nr:serine hydrolase [Brevibacillus dissolubilis]
MIKALEDQIFRIIDQAGGAWGVVIEDLHTKEKIEHQPDVRFFAASLIKVPIMTAVFADVYAGKYAFEDRLSLRQEDLVGGAGVLQHLQPGLSLSIYDLVMLMIIQSDNTATNILIDQAGRDSIRAIMDKTGMVNSQFYNKLMIIPAELEGRNEVTAGDMASILRHLAHGSVISYDSCLRMIDILKRQQLRDALPLLLGDPDHDIIGGQPKWELANKTGTVTGIEHDTGILYTGQSAVLISVLTKDATDSLTAKRAIGEIGKLVYEAYSRK